MVYQIPNLVCGQDEKSLRNNKNYRTIDTNKNGVRFHNTAVRQYNEEYLQAKEDYNEQQKSVVAEIMAIAGQSFVIKHTDKKEHLDLVMSICSV